MTDDITCTVIVPVHDGEAVLRKALEALRASTLAEGTWELIVVDDGSADDSAVVAAGYADMIVRLPAPAHGPSYARNRGAEVARGRVLVFVDADVVVRPETVGRLVDRLQQQPPGDAVVASLDPVCRVPGLVGCYQNLALHLAQRSSDGEVGAFWASCGAVRREAFLRCGMFNEWHFRAPEVEDLELGRRLTEQGGRIVREAAAPVAHLRSWALRPLAHALWSRGLAVARMRLSTRDEVLGSVGLIGGMVRARGLAFVLLSLPTHVVVRTAYRLGQAMGWLLLHSVGEPRPDPTVEAYAEVGVVKWPPVPARR